MSHHGLPARGVKDELVAFQGDEHQGEDGNGDGHALDEGRDLAQSLTQDPSVHKGVNDSDGKAHDAHEDVGAGEVGDEDVGDVPHLLLPRDDEDQAGVADEPHRDDGAVGDDQEGGAAHRVGAQVQKPPGHFTPQGPVAVVHKGCIHDTRLMSKVAECSEHSRLKKYFLSSFFRFTKQEVSLFLMCIDSRLQVFFSIKNEEN